jgi:hypothetical protein
MLAGIIQSPSNYSPINNYDKCIKRRNIVLQELLKDKKITNKKYNEIISKKIELTLSKNNNENNINFLYNQFALDEASKILNIDKNKILMSGYKIYTYQNPNIQNTLSNIISNYTYPKNSNGNYADSLSIIINNNNYGISAVAGKSNYNLVNFRRQPGSLIKPILVYSPALEENIIYPCSKILDEKININGYTPNNVGNKYYGYVKIEDAIGKSLNIPAIKICNILGIEKCKYYAKKCGIQFSPKDKGLAVALGGLTEGCTLKEITDAFEKNPKIDLFYGEIEFTKEDGTPMRVKKDHQYSFGVLLHYGCYIPSAATFWRRRAYEIAGDLDFTYKVTMDYEYWVRLAKLGCKFKFLPKTIASFAWHENNISTVFNDKRIHECHKVKMLYGVRLPFGYKFQEFYLKIANKYWLLWRQCLKTLRKFESELKPLLNATSLIFKSVSRSSFLAYLSFNAQRYSLNETPVVSRNFALK